MSQTTETVNLTVGGTTVTKPEKATPQAARLNQNLHLATIQNYIEAMAPNKPMGKTEGANWQKKLYHSLIGIIENKDANYAECMAELLRLFRVNASGALGMQYAARFMDTVGLSPSDRKVFERLLNMFILVADNRGRGPVTKQLSFEKTLAEGVSDQARQRLLNYFGV